MDGRRGCLERDGVFCVIRETIEFVRSGGWRTMEWLGCVESFEQRKKEEWRGDADVLRMADRCRNL